MKILVTYPKYMKNKVVRDLENEKQKAKTFNARTSTGKIGKMLGMIGKVSPVFQFGFTLDYTWSDVTDTSLKLEVIMPIEKFMKESILYGQIRNQFIKSYKHIVQTKLLK